MFKSLVSGLLSIHGVSYCTNVTFLLCIPLLILYTCTLDVVDTAASEASSSAEAEDFGSGTDKRAAVLKALDNITEETISKCVNILEKLALPASDAQVSE